MRRALATLLVAIPAAIVALLWVSPAATGQPVPAPGLRSVQHGDGLTGSGTTAAPLNLAPQACGGGSAVAGWGSDGTPTCVATGTLDGTGSAGKLATWTDADTLGYGSATSANLNITPTTCSGQFVSAISAGGIGTCASETGDISSVTGTSPISASCTTGACTVTTSMSTARLLGRTSASTGVVEQLTGTQVTAMLDVATELAKGLVPPLPDDGAQYLDGTGAWSTPADADHALVTVNAIPKGNSLTQVASLLSDDGSTVTNAGDTDLSAGTTTVGAFGGKVQVTTVGGNDFALNADTELLVVNGGTALFTGFAGGWDGREVTVMSINNAIIVYHNNSGSTLANRVYCAGATNWTSSGLSAFVMRYSGDASRWVVAKDLRFPTISVDGAATVGGLATFNGGATVGDAASDPVTINGHGTNVAIPIGRQIFTTSGTYTPTSGAYKVRIRIVGGGGGGGSTDDKATGSAESAAAGGASGAYLEHWIDPGAAITGGTVTVGAGGAGGTTGTTGAQGSTGGDSSVVVQGVTYTAHGGTGGYGGMSSGSTPVIVQGGAGGGASASSGTPDIAANGRDGGYAQRLNGTQAIAGKGGDSMLGKGGYPRMDPGTGYAGGAYGGGGGGGFDNALTSRAGGAGAAGVVIIEEYR